MASNDFTEKSTEIKLKQTKQQQNRRNNYKKCYSHLFFFPPTYLY